MSGYRHVGLCCWCNSATGILALGILSNLDSAHICHAKNSEGMTQVLDVVGISSHSWLIAKDGKMGCVTSTRQPRLNRVQETTQASTCSYTMMDQLL
jgi:hypothetical protein